MRKLKKYYAKISCGLRISSGEVDTQRYERRTVTQDFTEM